MKKVFLFLVLLSPLLSVAQVDDMYFVPKKEKKVLAVKSAEEIYMVDDVDSLEYVDEYADEAGNAYFTNDLFDVMDDYTYSTRIVRFQSPRRLLSSNLYWDLRYDCGINDWLVYDDGYTVYVYPTANNYLYSYPYYYSWMNRWNWNTFHGYHYNWHTPFYGYHDWWCYNDYYWHTPHWNHKVPGISWKPAHKSGNIPTNGMLSGNSGTVVRSGREQPSRATADGGNPRREQQVRATAGSGNPRRGQSARTTADSGNNPRREQQVRTTPTGNNPRREQQVRAEVASGSSSVRNTSGTSTRQGQARTSVNSSNVKRASTSSGSSVGRGESRSSSGYSRPSSTGVSRSSGSTSSGSSRSGSSYSSGSSRSSSSSSSSYSSGGGSRGGGSGSSGGGGGRSGGSRR